MGKPQVGIGVLLIREGKVLLGLRQGSHGENTWCPPGGHLGFNESFEDCAKRELHEETSLEIKNLKQVYVSNDLFKNDLKHYVTIFIKGEYVSGEALLKEPYKCKKWQWYNWENLPEPLFLPFANLKESGFHPLK